MKVSVIIPTYNEETELPFLLQDLAGQTLEHELIVADAQSTDKTREIASNYGAKIVDGGLPGIGRNRGAEVANGEVFFFLDADIRLFDKNILQNILADFLRRDLGSATTPIVPMTNSWLDYIGHVAYNKLTMWRAKNKPYAPGSIIVAERKVHEEIGGFDERIKLAEDHDYVFRASAVKKFGIIEESEVYVSVRRLRKDGRFVILLKYLLAAVHIEICGPITHDGFKYRFGYDTKKKKK